MLTLKLLIRKIVDKGIRSFEGLCYFCRCLTAPHELGMTERGIHGITESSCRRDK